MKIKSLSFLFCLGLASASRAQTPVDSAKNCDAFCETFTRVLQDRVHGFSGIKAAQKTGKGRVRAKASLPGATQCTVARDYQCTYDLGARADSARAFYRNLNDRIRKLIPAEWILTANSPESMGYSDPNRPHDAVKLTLANSGGGDDPWSGRIYPDAWHVVLTLEH